jgi:hypothetical protein
MRPVRNVFQKLSRTEQRREGVVAYLWCRPYTDTKMNVLFRAGARMSVIKLFLARNTIPFCGLNKTRR